MGITRGYLRVQLIPGVLAFAPRSASAHDLDPDALPLARCLAGRGCRDHPAACHGLDGSCPGRGHCGSHDHDHVHLACVGKQERAVILWFSSSEGQQKWEQLLEPISKYIFKYGKDVSVPLLLPVLTNVENSFGK